MLPAIVEMLPPPAGNEEGELRMLLFDAVHDDYRCRFLIPRNRPPAGLASCTADRSAIKGLLVKLVHCVSQQRLELFVRTTVVFFPLQLLSTDLVTVQCGSDADTYAYRVQGGDLPGASCGRQRGPGRPHHGSV